MIVVYIAVAVAAVAVIVAYERHTTLSQVEASVKEEIVSLEALVGSVSVKAKAQFKSTVARLKAIF